MAHAAPFADPATARSFIRAGNARLTLRSTATGTRYTYRVRAQQGSSPQDPQRAYYVELLKGPDNGADYSYIGMVRGQRFFTTKATHHLQGAAYCKAFRHAYEHLSRRGNMPPGTEIWHESKCGRCGRPLTVPSSIASGIGPECSKMGAL